ncbi:MAG: YncE family protein [Gammaproteobacteria bacterium]|nr:YncE family protein [Gammaproteobacteria bacterium]
MACGQAAAATLVFMALGPANRILAIDASRHQPTRTLLGVIDARAVVAAGSGLLVSGSFTSRPSEGGGAGELYVIDPAHGHTVLTLPVRGRIHTQAVTSDGRYVLSTHPDSNAISVFDLQSLQVARYLKTGAAPVAVVIRRLEPRAFVSNTGDGTVAEIDTRTWQVARHWSVDGIPRFLAIDREEKRLLVGVPEQGTVTVVQLDTGEVERRIPVGRKGFAGLALGEDGRSLFIGGPDTRITLLDIESGASRHVELGARPGDINPIAGTGTLYVASREKPMVWVLNQRNLELLETFELPAGEGFQVAVLSGIAPAEASTLSSH